MKFCQADTEGNGKEQDLIQLQRAEKFPEEQNYSENVFYRVNQKPLNYL